MRTTLLVGGPLDGSVRAPSPAVVGFIWVDSELRFFRAPGSRRCVLYRFECTRRAEDRSRVTTYVFAGYTHAHCCDTYWRREEAAKCPTCGKQPANPVGHVL